METYEGIKFKTEFIGGACPVSEKLRRLNHWVYIFGELGLAPVHPEGAYGNHSFREEGNRFVITKTGMKPSEKLLASDYCLVEEDLQKGLFLVQADHEPSSESFLHSLIYRNFSDVQVIMHGHSLLLNRYAETLGIEETEKECAYGTRELAESALDVCERGASFFILKNHGFVATGVDVETTAALVLRHYQQLLDKLTV